MTNRREFPENDVQCVRGAATVPRIAVLTLDVRPRLAVCRDMLELPVHRSHHRADRLEA